MKNKYFFNDRIIIRFLSLFAVGTTLFTLVWCLSYYFLPEGIMRGRGGAAVIVGADIAPSVLEEWGKIVIYNLVMLFIMALVNLILYLDRFPLGYVTPLGMITLYAICLGTNSFSIPMVERMAPTLAVLERSGPYEMTAFILVVVATYNQSRFAFNKKMHSFKDIPRISPVPRLKLEQWVGIGLAIALILYAGWREATMILAL